MMSTKPWQFAAVLLTSVGLGLLGGCAGRRTTAVAPGTTAPAVELRAFWVDEFHAGIRTPQEAEQLVADAKRANVNTLFVQVRGRADSLYTQSFEPPREDPTYDPAFDALANIIEVGHRGGIEVHAWINAMPVWRDPQPPRDPRHVYNLHGPGHPGEDDWLTHSPTGETKFPVGYFLDPGHPAAAAYLAEVYLNIVRHYAVDGIHFDYIRYPETDQSLPRGATVGYNPTNLARFRRATGRTDTPAPDDEQWTIWRRQQVTQFVRRVSIEARAINPRIKITAAVIAWGKPPLSEKDFADVSPMQRVFQDWHSWLKEGLLDMAVPMNYIRDADPARREWFDGWIRWEKRHKHGRQLAVGIGAYLNPPPDTLAQIQRVRHPEGKYNADGVSFFSYASLWAQPAPAGAASANAVPGAEPAKEDAPDRMSFLVNGAPPESGAFASPATIPPMDWIARPTRGWVAGVVRDVSGQPVDGVRVALKSGGWFGATQRTVTDGNGYYGFSQLKPGRYRVRIDSSAPRRAEAEVEVVAGRVARAELVQP